MAHDQGSLLVGAGLIGKEQLQLARKAAAQHGGTVGEHLVLCNYVDDDTLTDFYVARLRVQRVTEADLGGIAPRLLKLVPPDMAQEFRVLPIGIDTDQSLVIAMSDPANQHAIDEIHFFTGRFVVRKVATQAQIAWGLAHYYAIITPLARGGHSPGGAPPRIVAGASAPNRAFPRAQGGAGADPVAAERAALASRPPSTNPPELSPRSGQFTAQPAPREPERLPAVVVDEDDLAEPVLLERRARKQFSAVEREETAEAEAEPADAAGSSDVLLLDEGMRRARHTSRQTEPGYGSAAAVDSRTDARQDTEVSSPTPSDDEHQGERPVSGSETTTKKKSRGGAAEKRTAKADKNKVSKGDKNKVDADATTTAAAPAPAAAPAAAAPAARQEVPARAKRPSVDDGWDVDDSWGVGPTDVAPTAPAAAAIPENELPPEPSEVIVAENAASAQVQALAPDEDTQRVRAAAAAAAAPLPPPDPAELERSSNRLLETVRKLERSGSRDQVIDVLLDHLGAACRRRAFFAIKGGQLVAFRQEGAARPGIGTAQMALDGAASTFADVASKRLPYFGTVSSDASDFVNQALGSGPSGEAVVVPIQMRGRAIALLYGDGLAARVFEEHQMVLGRAAGDALERIVRSSKPHA